MRSSGGAIKWADVGALKAELEAQVGCWLMWCFVGLVACRLCVWSRLASLLPLAQVAALLGPKTEADMVKPDKKKKPAKAAAAPAGLLWATQGVASGQHSGSPVGRHVLVPRRPAA